MLAVIYVRYMLLYVVLLFWTVKKELLVGRDGVRGAILFGLVGPTIPVIITS